MMKCTHCSKTVTTHTVCNKCKNEVYCNRECAKAHWKKHKKQCANNANRVLTQDDGLVNAYRLKTLQHSVKWGYVDIVSNPASGRKVGDNVLINSYSLEEHSKIGAMYPDWEYVGRVKKIPLQGPIIYDCSDVYGRAVHNFRSQQPMSLDI